MKIEKYALLDTDFISKTHFIHGDTEKCLVDLVVEMPGYCFFCHSQIIKELSRHNQQAIGWLQHKISEQKIQCYGLSLLFFLLSSKCIGFKKIEQIIFIKICA